MRIVKWLLIVFLVLVLAIVAWLAYMGMFSPVKITEEVTGPYILVYENFVGPYKDTGPVFDRVHKLVKAQGIESTNSIGIYYDDPSKVPADQLRSECGVAVARKDLPKLYKVRGKYRVKVIPKKMRIIAAFPLRNVFSYMFAPIKAYPALMQYAEKNGCQMMSPYELYDMKAGKIYIAMERAEQ